MIGNNINQSGIRPFCAGQQFCPFASVAIPAGCDEIADVVRAAFCNWANMIDFKKDSFRRRCTAVNAFELVAL